MSERVTQEAWAEQVQRADNAELREARSNLAGTDNDAPDGFFYFTVTFPAMKAQEAVRIEATVSRFDEAARHATYLLAIHGERPAILTALFEALASSDQLFAAQRIAERMVLGTPLERARGRVAKLPPGRAPAA